MADRDWFGLHPRYKATRKLLYDPVRAEYRVGNKTFHDLARQAQLKSINNQALVLPLPAGDAATANKRYTF